MGRGGPVADSVGIRPGRIGVVIMEALGGPEQVAEPGFVQLRFRRIETPVFNRLVQLPIHIDGSYDLQLSPDLDG